MRSRPVGVSKGVELRYDVEGGAVVLAPSGLARDEIYARRFLILGQWDLHARVECCQVRQRKGAFCIAVRLWKEAVRSENPTNVQYE